MEIYLDANATTPVLAQARQAALQAMADDFGNPSSIHSTGLKARAMMDAVRQRARQLLQAGEGSLLFVSGATEGIQTAVLSALSALRDKRERGEPIASLLLYGATEHKAVPETLKHWNHLLGLNLLVQAIPVDTQGRHDLDFLRAHASDAAMVCVMAANNETGIISDLEGVQAVLAETQSPAFFMVDGVQALGKLPLKLAHSRIDYAPFSGHKLYAPKGIGLLYVREGAPFTPLLAGGGQEGSLRSGTENMSGIAALGAVLQALDDGQTFRTHDELCDFRSKLATALQEAFPGLVFNAPLDNSLPTTLNFSVPGLSSKVLLNMFDAADVRVSGGSACSAAKAAPSFVLQAMGLPDWQTASAVRMSFGPAVDAAFIDEAVARIAACGQVLRQSCLSGEGDLLDPAAQALASDGVVQLSAEGQCSYLVLNRASQRAVVIDPHAALLDRIEQLLRCQAYQLQAVLHTEAPDALDAEARSDLLERLGAVAGDCDALGWPLQSAQLSLAGGQVVPALALGSADQPWLASLSVPGHAPEARAYLLGSAVNGAMAPTDVRQVFSGALVSPGRLAPCSGPGADAAAQWQSVQRLAAVIAEHSLICPGQDEHGQVATTLASERQQPGLLAQCLKGSLDEAAFVNAKRREDAALAWGAGPAPVTALSAEAHLDGEALSALLRARPDTCVVDVREPYEQLLSQTPRLADWDLQALPLSRLVNGLGPWLEDDSRPLVFFCRTGNRSQQALLCLQRLGRANCYQLAGGLALWERHSEFMHCI